MACNRSNMDKQAEPRKYKLESGSNSSDVAAAEKVDATASEPLTIQDKDRPSEDLPSVPGYYLYCVNTTPPVAASSLSLDCGVRDADKRPTVETGLWSGAFEEALAGESLITQDDKKGIFEVKFSAPSLIRAGTKRARITFKGTIAGQNVELSGYLSDLLSPPQLTCAPGYLQVPGDPLYAVSDFCVMKYEARKGGDGSPATAPTLVPWVSINRADALTACRSLGINYDLISNDVWMTLATLVASRGSNWSSGTVGGGLLNRGHTDNNPSLHCEASANDALAYVETTCTPISAGLFDQRRTHQLPSGESIWDLSGNVYDMTSTVLSSNSAKPSGTSAAFLQTDWNELPLIDTGFSVLPLNRLRPIKAEKPFWNDTWTSAQGIGMYNPGTQGTGGLIIRGGDVVLGAYAGLFMTSLSDPPTVAVPYIGFRCISHESIP